MTDVTNYLVEEYLNNKYLVNVRKTLNTDNLCEYAIVMMLSEYISGADEKLIDNRETFRREIRRLYDEAKDLQDDRKIHIVQIRSIPVADYYYLLRHYFVRIDELIDVHPGNEQRLCLRGWYTNTDVGSDTLESEYRLCKRCLDECLPKLWEGAKRFNFVFRNCDQCCNRSHQSIGIAVAFLLTISSTVSFATNGHFAPMALIFFSYAIIFVVLHYGHLYSSSLTPWLGYNPSVSNRNARSFVCQHVGKKVKKI